MIKTIIILCFMGVLLGACGSAGSNGNTPNLGSSTVTITGNAMAGAINGTLTVAQDGTTNRQSANIAEGIFSLALPLSWLALPLTFTVNGTYRDEVSGQMITINALSAMSLHTPANTLAGAGGHVAITPDITVIAKLVQSGMTDVYASQLFQSAFGYVPAWNTHPFDPYTTTPALAALRIQADSYASDASFRLGMFSQLAQDLGLNNPADIALLPQKLADDLGDGLLNGSNGVSAVRFPNSGMNLQLTHAITPLSNRLSLATARFVGSGSNQAGLLAPVAGLPALASDLSGANKLITLSNGTVIKVQLDVNYASPFAAAFQTSRSHHRITLTNNANNQPINVTLGNTIATVSITPTVFMYTGDQYTAAASMIDTRQAVQGLFAMDIYYWQASNHGNTPKGQWQLTVLLIESITGVQHQVLFYPNIAMLRTGERLSAKAYNNADVWADMQGNILPREYRVWLQDITSNAAGGHDVSVFISSQDMVVGNTRMQIIFPAVATGVTLHGALNNGTRPRQPLHTVVVEILSGNVWQPMSPVAGKSGQYRFHQLLGLRAGIANRLAIRLTVNGKVMTDVRGNNPSLLVIP